MTRRGESVREEARRIPWAEWIVAAIGLALLGGALAVVLSHGATSDDSPPVIVVTPTRVTRTSAGWLVEFSARNQGAQPAAHIEIVGRLAGTEGKPEESRAQLDYLAGRSTARGGLYFATDPTNRLELRATGYRRP